MELWSACGWSGSGFLKKELQITPALHVEYRDPDMEVAPQPSPGLRENQDLSDMLDMLKREHAACVERGELWDANAIQNLILNFLYDVRTGPTRTMLANYKQKVVETFEEMKNNAVRQNRWDSADHYRMI